MFAAPQTAPAAHAGGLGGLGEVTLALLLVLGAVFALAWVLKRLRGFGPRAGNGLEVIAHVPLGPKERAVLLRVGPNQILLGVAPGRVNTLYVLPEPLEAARTAGTPATSGATSFGTLLKSLTR
jgi:flagellar protein FliO/FliZ